MRQHLGHIPIPHDRQGILLFPLFKSEVSEAMLVQRPHESGVQIDPTSFGYRSGIVDMVSQLLTEFLIANDVLQEYTQALRDEYSVSVNKGALDAYFSNQGYGGRR